MKPAYVVRKQERMRERYATDPEYRAKRRALCNAWREKNKERVLQYAKDYYWSHLEWARAEGRKRQQARPKELRNKALRDFLNRNPHLEQAYKQNRRARKARASGTVTRADIQRLYRRFSGICAYCPERATSVDHVMPLVRGGRHTIGNLVPACGLCNSRKNKLTVMEWRMRQIRSAKTEAA